MSFRERLKNIVKAAVEPLPEKGDLPSKEVFADGLCDICQQTLGSHPQDVKGKVRDCNGWELTFRV